MNNSNENLVKTCANQTKKQETKEKKNKEKKKKKAIANRKQEI